MMIIILVDTIIELNYLIDDDYFSCEMVLRKGWTFRVAFLDKGCSRETTYLEIPTLNGAAQIDDRAWVELDPWDAYFAVSNN